MGILSLGFLVCKTEGLVMGKQKEAPVGAAFIHLCLAALFPLAEAFGRCLGEFLGSISSASVDSHNMWIWRVVLNA